MFMSFSTLPLPSLSLSQNQSTLTQVQPHQPSYKEVTTLYFVVQIVLWCFFFFFGFLSTLSSPSLLSYSEER